MGENLFTGEASRPARVVADHHEPVRPSRGSRLRHLSDPELAPPDRSGRERGRPSRKGEEGRRRPTPATVLAAAALVIAVLGTNPVGNAAWNAVVPKGSVGTAQLKNNAVVSAKAKKGSLLKADFEAGQMPAGATGTAGPAGPAGAAGVSGYEVVTVTSATNSTSPKDVTANCPSSKKPVGGGAVMNNSGYDVDAYYSYLGGNGWTGGFKEDTATAGSWWGRVYVSASPPPEAPGQGGPAARPAHPADPGTGPPAS